MYRSLGTGQFQNRPPPPPPEQTPGHLTFLKNVGHIPRYVASLDGQMPHPLELQRGSNPPHSRENRIAYLWK